MNFLELKSIFCCFFNRQPSYNSNRRDNLLLVLIFIVPLMFFIDFLLRYIDCLRDVDFFACCLYESTTNNILILMKMICNFFFVGAGNND